MTTGRTTNLDLALPVEGELTGQWGDMVNNGITKYVDIAVAGTQIISGNQTAVTLTSTEGDDTNDNIAQVGAGATGSSQYMIIRCSGNPASLLTITAPTTSKVYVVINATSTSQSVKIVGAGPTTGVTIETGEKALVAWNGSDFVKVSAYTNQIYGQTNSATPFNTKYGYLAGASTTASGVRNTFVGWQAGTSVGNGTDNVAVGYNALTPSPNFTNCVAVGSNAMSAAAASQTVAIGTNTLRSFQSSNGVAIGYEALYSATSGGSNIAIGSNSLRLTNTGDSNVAVGGNTLRFNTSGSYNVAVGHDASYTLIGGSSNVALGRSALYSNDFASNNVAIGDLALSTTVAGSNVGVGYQAGRAVTSGNTNTLIGYQAGYSGTNNLTTGSNNTIIGSNAAASAATVNNEITLGNGSIATLRCQVTTITSLSDARDKTNVRNLDAGLNFVKALRPVAFDWNMRDGGKVGDPDTGFLAQDLQIAQQATGVNIPGLVYDVNPEKLEAGYGKLIPVLVKAVQELAAEVERLKRAD